MRLTNLIGDAIGAIQFNGGLPHGIVPSAVQPEQGRYETPHSQMILIRITSMIYSTNLLSFGYLRFLLAMPVLGIAVFLNMGAEYLESVADWIAGEWPHPNHTDKKT